MKGFTALQNCKIIPGNDCLIGWQELNYLVSQQLNHKDDIFGMILKELVPTHQTLMPDAMADEVIHNVSHDFS